MVRNQRSDTEKNLIDDGKRKGIGEIIRQMK